MNLFGVLQYLADQHLPYCCAKKKIEASSFFAVFLFSDRVPANRLYED